MPILLDPEHGILEMHAYTSEDEFERDVVAHAEHLFGESAIYIDVKKKVSGNNIATIPDGYVIDVTVPGSPKLYVVENEIVSHDPFRHIGIQMLKFVTAFDAGQRNVRRFLMEEIQRQPSNLSKLENAAHGAGTRNVDAYLDKAVYQDFRGLVVIDEARPELHQVIARINADISVLEFKAFSGADGRRVFQLDTLYDEFEQVSETPGPNQQSETREIRRRRRAQADTIIVPAREDGFESAFLGENCWYAIRIGAAMKDKLKYIAAYQVAPVSAVTHMAEIEDIQPYKDTGKYIVTFKAPAESIGPIPVREGRNSPQGPVYVRKERLMNADYYEDAFQD